MTRKIVLQCLSALAAAGAVAIGTMSPGFTAPVASGAAAIGKAVPGFAIDIRWWGYGPGPYYYGPPAAFYRPRYYGPPVYVAPPPPVIYQPPPVVFEPAPDAGGPIRQCWVETDRDRGYGYWRPC